MSDAAAPREVASPAAMVRFLDSDFLYSFRRSPVAVISA